MNSYQQSFTRRRQTTINRAYPAIARHSKSSVKTAHSIVQATGNVNREMLTTGIQKCLTIYMAQNV